MLQSVDSEEKVIQLAKDNFLSNRYAVINALGEALTPRLIWKAIPMLKRKLTDSPLLKQILNIITCRATDDLL